MRVMKVIKPLWLIVFLDEIKKETKLFWCIVASNFVIKYIIDWPLTIKLMGHYNYFISLSIVIMIYFLWGIISVKLYDYFKVDLGIEKFKEYQINNREVDFTNKFIKIITSKSGMNKFSLGIAITWLIKPGLSIIYFRNGCYKYDGFNSKEMVMFFIKNILFSCIVWSLFIFCIHLLYNLLFH